MKKKRSGRTPTPRHRRFRTDSGLTVLEVLISMGVLVVASLAAFAYSVRQDKASVRKVRR